MDDEWTATINEEYGTTETPETPEPTDTSDEESGVEAQAEPAAAETEDSTPPVDPVAPVDPVEATPKEVDEPEEKYVPKDAIKEALRELDAETQRNTAIKSELKGVILDKLYPEGIDRQLRDSDGDPIKGIDDLTKLINPNTNELFTEDEAGAWLLSAQQKLNNDIVQMESYAEKLVEVDVNLRDGADRVEQVYGDLLKQFPDVATDLMHQYNATIVRDPKSGLVLDTPVDIVKFYDVALRGYAQAAEAAKAKAEEAAKVSAAQAKAEQVERADLSRMGTADTLSKDDRGWANAMEEYYNS